MQIKSRFNRIDNVIISGGTHGNEATGVYLIEEWEKDCSFLKRDSFESDFFCSNPRAVDLNLRYTETDLNRCFLDKDLNDESCLSYEELLAYKIKNNLRKDYAGKTTLLVDMHTTTSNMGISIMCDDNAPNLLLSAMVKHRMPEVHVYCIKKADRTDSCLRSSGTYGIGIEVGPIPQGVLRHDTIESMRKTVATVLDIAHEINTESAEYAPFSIEYFTHLAEVTYPDGPFGDAMIHKDLEGKDYDILRPGDNIFYGAECGNVQYDGKEEVHPVFINEAAYYEKGLAFSTMKKEHSEFILLK